VLAFARLAYRIPLGTKIGHINCQGSILGRDIYSAGSGDAFDPKEPRRLFGQAAEAAGYKTRDNGSLFGDEASDTPGLLVAGAIISEYSEICQFARKASFLGATSTTRQTIEWEVYDPLVRKVIYKATTQGEGQGTGPGGQNTVALMRSGYAAFQAAAHNLMYDSGFHAVATGASDEAAGNSSPAAGPEGTSPFAMPEAAGLEASLTIPRSRPSTQPFTKQVEELRKQVVTVFTGLGSGSGFYISDTLLLTNQHVVGTGKDVRIKFHSGREIPGRVLATNARRDVAVIRTDTIDAKGLPLHLGDPDVGSQVFVIGSPFGKQFEGTVTSGIVSALRTLRYGRFIQSDIMVNHGNSGGPMFDDKGNVLGITDIGIEPEGVPAGLNFFIPIGEALQMLGITQTDGGS
jgi:S1-C subfamily serine protease